MRNKPLPTCNLKGSVAVRPWEPQKHTLTTTGCSWAVPKLRGAFLALALLGSAQAGDREFKRIVDRLENTFQKKPMGTGFLGFVARCFTPKGVRGLRMAIFDEVEQGHRLEPRDFDTFVRGVMGEVQPLVHVQSRKQGEQTYVYLQPRDCDFELMVISVEAREAVVMRMNLDPKEVEKWMEDPAGMAHKRGCVQVK